MVRAYVGQKNHEDNFDRPLLEAMSWKFATCWKLPVLARAFMNLLQTVFLRMRKLHAIQQASRQHMVHVPVYVCCGQKFWQDMLKEGVCLHAGNLNENQRQRQTKKKGYERRLRSFDENLVFVEQHSLSPAVLSADGMISVFWMPC